MQKFIEKNTRTIRRTFHNIKKLIYKPFKINMTEFRTKVEFYHFYKKYSKISDLAVKLNKELQENYTSQNKLKGYCLNCNEIVNFNYDFMMDAKVIWYREQLICPLCGFNNRHRIILHLLKNFINKKGLKIYLYEQITQFYSVINNTYGVDSKVVGSEFLNQDLKSGTIVDGIRHEDALNLSFENDSIDLMISNDIFEHIPDIKQAFKEAHRVLKKGGNLLFTVPFYPDYEETLIRANVENGEIVYLTEKEIHGNPLSEEGSLVFYTFGWDIMKFQKEAGFKDPYAIAILDDKCGHFDYTPMLVFVAQK